MKTTTTTAKPVTLDREFFTWLGWQIAINVAIGSTCGFAAQAVVNNLF